MDLGRPTARLFALTVAAALPPIVVAFIGITEPSWLDRFGAGTLLLILVLVSVAWAAVVSVVGGRALGADLQAMLELARRGREGGQTDAGTGAAIGGAVERLASMLDERNRQIGELAVSLRDAPIQADVREVARSTVSAAISVTRDPTWTLAVLRSPRATALPTGIYSAEGTSPQPLTDVATWAATLEPDDAATPGVRHGIGPWGAFVVVEVAAGTDLRAHLMAPWEGRAAPSRAERELMSLLGQNAAIAIEHALLVEQLRSQTDELNRMAAVQSDFLRGVTHDLQTPLTSIRAVASELAADSDLGDPARRDLETIGHQADRLRRMVAQLLVASRLEVGAFQPRQEVFRLEPMVRRTWEAMRATRPFDLQVGGVPHLTVGDPDRVEQVIWALMDNAIKYSPEGSPIAVRVSGEENGDGLRSQLEVADSGTGMDPDTQRHAFDQFYRSDQARRLAPDGSGVGLYAAHGLIEAMGGEITIKSQLGKGTSIAISLPGEADGTDAEGHASDSQDQGT